MNAVIQQRAVGLLRSPRFDTTFIVGIASIAILTGAFVTARPDYFVVVLIADLWLLGYHHVISTYTRLAFDTESLKEHKHLLLYLPPAVAISVTALALTVGAWSLATIYLYWQWFHYTRQSEGIAKAYAGKSRGKDLGDALLRRLAFYAVPLAGILHVSARDPDVFLEMPLKTLPVPGGLLVAVDAIAAGLFALWLAQQFRAWRNGRLAVAHFCYVLSHFAVFMVAYVVLTNINFGWLTVNVWHNAQYILFVWLFNNCRFNGSIDPKRVFLSTISQNGRFPLYLGVCVVLSTAVYVLIARFGVPALSSQIGVSIAVAAIIIYQTINFHHYIVDSLIWKLRKPAIASKLGLSPKPVTRDSNPGAKKMA